MRERKSKARIFMIAIIVVAFVAAVAIFIINSMRNATLNLMLLPYENAVAEIDGKTYKSGSYTFFPADNVDIKIKSEGYFDKDVTVSLESHKTTVVKEYLIPEDNNITKYKKSDTDIKLFGMLFADDDLAMKLVKQHKEAMLIGDELPIQKIHGQLRGTNASVSGNKITIIMNGTYDNRCTKDFCLLVGGTKKDEQVVRDIIKEHGYNYDDYEVLYE